MHSACFVASQDAHVLVRNVESLQRKHHRVHQRHRNSILLSTLTGSAVDGRVSRPGEMTEISGRRGLARPPCSAAVDSNTAISSSSSQGHPHGEDKDSAMLTCYKKTNPHEYEVIATHFKPGCEPGNARKSHLVMSLCIQAQDVSGYKEMNKEIHFSAQYHLSQRLSHTNTMRPSLKITVSQ